MKTALKISSENGIKIHTINYAIKTLALQPDDRIGAIRLYGPEKESQILDYAKKDHRVKV